MDKRTRAEINKINGRIPKHLAGNLIKTVVDTSEEELARIAIADKSVDPRTKKRLKYLLAKGAFRHESQELNEEVGAEIEEYHRRAIAKATKAGKLAPPNSDPFWVERQKRINEQRRQ